ncbi:hypothetical protein BJ944DRAFT_86918 [Cunninghamella echinulata]|nr:hypothetical protein BJ944DRAFT_86918 [Cunninghamella echinulata]
MTMDYYSTLTNLPVIELPVASCYFETLHKRSVPNSTSSTTATNEISSSVSISDLINAPSKVEPIFDQLSIDQLFSIEQTLKKIKKRKAKQMSHDNNNGLQQPKKKKPCVNPTSITQSGPPVIEVRDGIEWVSFVYSHNRVLKRYTIRTDIDNICLDNIDVQFQLDNCVYPRANVPKEEYRGNRWNYETQCNMLGWKLAWINQELTGKRGLIQRAVDFYRNRTPTMRSRRVARQAKLLDGSLKKRKSTINLQDLTTNKYDVIPNIPKTMTMEDDQHERLRVKITLDQVNVDDIDMEFRISNCVYPRAMKYQQQCLTDIQEQEIVCNELGWKLAWLNPQLTSKMNLLQRALDLYRIKFMPSFAPRKRSPRTPPNFSTDNKALSSTINNLLLQQKQQEQLKPELNTQLNDNTMKHIDIQHSHSPTLSFTTGTTESMDFGDCFSMNSDDDHSYRHSPTMDFSSNPSSLWADDIADSCDLASIATLNTSLSSSSSADTTSLLCTPDASPIHSMTPSQLIDDSFLFKNDACNTSLFNNDSFDLSLMDTNMLLPPIIFNDDDNHGNSNSEYSNNQTGSPSTSITDFNNNNTYDYASFDQDLMLKMEESANLFSLF